LVRKKGNSKLTPVLVLVFALGLAIAYINGANDVSKGIATLVGSGVTDYRRAVVWGTLWTGAGAVVGAFLATAMVQTFGRGLFASGVHPTLVAAVATIAGAALWVALATWKGLPVSTTHAIVGSVAGVAVLAYGVEGVNWMGLAAKIALPLLLSPVLSLGLTVTVLKTWSALAPNSQVDCVCAETETAVGLSSQPDGVMAFTSAMPQLQITTCNSTARSAPGITLNHLHWVTSGATSFARGLNDAPKMVALILGAAFLAGHGTNFPIIYFVVVAGGMMAGSWIAGQRVTDVLARKVTRMDHREGFVANLITAALVAPAAALGLPMSTTHVASGAIIGVATRQSDGVNWKVVWEMMLAWIVTLPFAAALGMAVFFVVGRLRPS
jgi:inorganic phosphate transporter, PiT family